MRASGSWPRSSVQSGRAHDGPVSRAVKSISLIDTFQAMGTSKMASTITIRMKPLASARRWRRKRRQASSPGEKLRARACAGVPASAVANAWVEPSIEDIGDQVEEDDEAGEHEGD